MRTISRIVIFGRLPASSEILSLLLGRNLKVPYVVIDGARTYKPRESGRKPLEMFARAKGIPAISLEEFEEISETDFFDLGIVSCFQRKLSQGVLTAFRHGVINIHPGILPQYAGVFSDIHAILNGEKHGGVTVHWVNEILDGGRLIQKKLYEIGVLRSLRLH